MTLRGIFKVQLGWHLPLNCSLCTLFQGKEFYFSFYDDEFIWINYADAWEMRQRIETMLSILDYKGGRLDA
jgi:hypothetical protein